MAMNGGRDLRDPNELRRLRALHQRQRLGRPEPGRGRGGGLLAVLVLGAVVLLVGAGLVVAGLTVLRPVVRSAVVAWAGDNPSALEVRLVADLVREDIGNALTSAASTDTAQVAFKVVPGDTAVAIAERLRADGLLIDERAFVYLAVEKGVAERLEAGDYVLRRNMTPTQLVGSLLLAQDPAVTITFREGLRLEQLSAKLQTVPLRMDVEEFYRLASSPPADLLAAVPWLRLPEGRSLEGFLYPDTYRILTDTTPEELLLILLNRFHDVVGDARLEVPESRGLSFYQVITLASIVEQEAQVDEERPLIAGVYQNRLDVEMALQADPTVLYARDTVELGKLDFDRWPEYAFWTPLDMALADYAVPKALRGYQTYQVPGLIPGPISTPSLASIDAALTPDGSKGYLFFVAKGDGTGTHAFAKTYAQHLKNLKKYGYR